MRVQWKCLLLTRRLISQSRGLKNYHFEFIHQTKYSGSAPSWGMNSGQMDNNYKASKEAFVSGTTGSSVFHVNLVLVVGLVSPVRHVGDSVAQGHKASIALHSALRTRLAVFRSMPFILEWLVLVLPLSFALTVYADAPGVLSVLLLAPTCVLLLLPPIESGTPLLSKKNETQSGVTARDSGMTDRPVLPALTPLPALTTYRANMMLITVFSILAVDFPIFPRPLAKCETYGVSLVRAALIHMLLELFRSGRVRWIAELGRSFSLRASFLQYPSSKIHPSWMRM